jgi:hypothetical protein
MIIEFRNIKHENIGRHKNHACVNVCIALKVEEAGSSYVG